MVNLTGSGAISLNEKTAEEKFMFGSGGGWQMYIDYKADCNETCQGIMPSSMLERAGVGWMRDVGLRARPAWVRADERLKCAQPIALEWACVSERASPACEQLQVVGVVAPSGNPGPQSHYLRTMSGM